MTVIKAEMAATVWKIKVVIGSEVSLGDELMILESMKMEIPVSAPAAGVVTGIQVAEGGLVSPGDPMMNLGPLSAG